MGADFLYAACPTPVDRNGKLISEWSDKVETEIRVRIGMMPSDLLDRYMDMFYDLGEEYRDGIITKAEVDDHIVATCKTAVETFGRSRETGMIRLDGMDRDWYLTGGLSWSDPPTDAFDVMNAVDCSRLFTESFPFDA